MSAGAFTTSRYEANAGTIHNIRVQPETLTATFDGTTNAAPAGAVDSAFWAKCSKGNTEYGLRPRSIVIAWDAGAAPTGYLETDTIPIPVMTPAVFAGASIGDAISYLGGTGTVSAKRAENLFPLS